MYVQGIICGHMIIGCDAVKVPRRNMKSFIGRFQAIKTDVLLIFSFITGDKTAFLSSMMFSNEYITGI